MYAALKGKGRPGGSQYCQKKKQIIESEATTSHSETVNDLVLMYTITCLFILGVPNPWHYLCY